MELTKVTRDPGRAPRSSTIPGIVVVGRFFPTDRVEWLELSTAKGPLTRQLMERFSHRFRSVGGQTHEQRLAIVDGIEVFTNPGVLCDPGATVNHARLTQKLCDRLTPPQSERLQKVCEDLSLFDASGDLAAGELPRVEEAIARLRELSRENPALERVVQTAAKPVQVVRAAQRLKTVLFAESTTESSSTSLQVRSQQHLALCESNAMARQDAAREELRSYAASWASVGLLELNSQGNLGERVYFVNCPDPEGLLANGHSQLIDMIGTKTDVPSINILLAEPLLAVESIHVLEPYFDINPSLLAGIYATFGGYSDPEDDLIDIAADYPAVGSVGAGSLWMHVGKAKYRGLSSGVSGAVLGNRLANDPRLDATKRGFYGRLIPSFGSQPTKVLAGLDELDTQRLSKRRCKTLGRAGFNTIRENRRKKLTAFSSRTRSSLPDYCQVDVVRHTLASLGEAQHHLEEFIGDLNDPTVQRLAAEEVEKTVFGPYRNVPGVSTKVVPAGASDDATTFAINITGTWPDPIESIAISFSRAFSV